MKFAATLLVVLLAGCGSPPPHRETLLVFAAASLRNSFTDLGGAFADANPNAGVELSTAGSADLLAQLTHGAVADVLATADALTMDRAAVAGLLAGPAVPFATNSLTIVVAPGNPKGISSFRDLPDVTLVVCAVQVPCGSALPMLQDRTGVRLAPVSEESSVADVLNKVTSGQADAGLVYVTDARAAGAAVTAVALPEASDLVNGYRIAVLKGSPNPDLASRFVDLVTGPTGRRVLAAAGFGTP
ncbi:MAG: molybdate ABC transporter substrate-binding protein [Actinomycetota bacterium]|nr:molybdate ABC transporter substrate-binding protein [Actinomycetota bacterium]MDA2949456.1 molybdate ABC transporter substrate-binding protein [Actinomycetota bacterium]MDA2992047.1 molybdate ABC transporter substrate-binding protein [Actinomycetota bacterium]